MSNRKFTWFKPDQCDILVYDGEGSDMLALALPDEAVKFIVNNRTEIPLFLSFNFFSNIVVGILKFRRLNHAIIYAIIKTLNPKVIITYIDNSSTIGWIADNFKYLSVITVQNGVRWDLSNKNQTMINYDYYCAFGEVEKDILAISGNSVKNFYSIGSLRAGIFKESCKSCLIESRDLCYISQYEPLPDHYAKVNEWTQSMLRAYLDVGVSYFSNIARYAFENKLNLTVAMRYPIDHQYYELEKNFYLKNSQNHIQLIPQNKFSSYSAVESSRLTYTISSTLGYEALGWGQKVIFAKDIPLVASLVIQGLWSNNLVTYNLVDLQRLYSLDYIELESKSNFLLKMKDEDYINKTKFTKNFYMNYDEKNPPQKIIKKLINNILLGDI